MNIQIRNTVIAFFSALCFSSGAAHAQLDGTSAAVSAAPAAGGKPASSLFDLPLDDVLNIDVSTASKLQVKGTQSPSNLVVVTQDQIRRYGYKTVGQAMERVVGFVNSELGSSTFTGYRGLTPQSSTTNPRILVLVDGVRYNEWVFDQAALNERFPLDIESVDRIEVLKGAGSAIWGTNAVFAVINVISKTADSARAQQVLVERRSNNTTKSYASWAGTTDGGFKYFASASVTDEDDDFAAYYPGFDTPPDSNGVTRSPYHQKGHHANLKVSYDDFYGQVAYGYNDYRLGSSVDFIFGDAGTAEYHDVPIRSEVGYKTKVWEEQDGEFLLRNYYTSDRYSANSYFPNREVPGETFQEKNNFSTQATGVEAHSQKIFKDLTGLVGAELTRVFNNQFEQDFRGFRGTEELFEEGRTFEATQTIQSYFYDLMYQPVEEITLFFGGRLDRFSGLDDVFGPRATLVVNPRDDTTLRFIYSKGLRNPSIGERFASSESREQVKHEDLNSYEVFAEHRFNDKVTVSTAFFYYDLSDTIGFVAFEGGGQVYGNTKGLKSSGAELEVRAKLDDDIEGYSTFTYAAGESKVSDAAPIKSFPHALGRLGVSVGEKRDSFIFTPELAFGSGTESTDGKEFDPFTIVNLTLASYPTASGFNISASVYNIFDQEYVRPVRSNPEDSLAERAVEAGREFRVQAKWDF